VANADAADAEAHRLGCTIRSKQALTEVTHTFTHFRLTITPLLCDVAPTTVTAEPGTRWLAAADLAQAPLPAPVRKLLAVLLDQPAI
jgi:A/G-specific adenine glycosylase